VLQILLATLNGERWLPEQLASIAAQTRQDWQLLARDDGSGDGTLGLLKAAAQADERIHLLPSGAEQPSGAAGNFARLLEHVDLPAATPIFLADQDDCWHPTKAERLASLLQDSVLAFSDARLVDASGTPLGSLFTSLGVGAEVALDDVLAENPAAGCTMAFRAELLQLARPIPPAVINHDWWLLVCALCLGPVAICREPLMDYRQHGANVVGASAGLSRLPDLPKLLQRQRRVLLGKPVAIRELTRRLESAGRSVPDELTNYLSRFERVTNWRRALALLRGHYAPRRWSLRLLQVLALLFPPWARIARDL
jgi:hypothetical protein